MTDQTTATTPKDGGPAFPGPDQSEQKVNIHEGLSIRDYFAAKAMLAFMSREYKKALSEQYPEVTAEEIEMLIAQAAYLQADAMLTARTGGAQ